MVQLHSIEKKKNLVAQSCPTLSDLMDYGLPGSCLWNSPGKNTGVGSHSLLQGIFPTQGSNLGLPALQILHHRSHQGGQPYSLFTAGHPYLFQIKIISQRINWMSPLSSSPKPASICNPSGFSWVNHKSSFFELLGWGARENTKYKRPSIN